MMRLVSIQFPFHARKLREDLESRLAGFFGMELHAQDVVTFDCGGERFNVMRGCGRVGGDGGFVGVGEVDVRALLDTREETGFVVDLQ